MPNRKYEIGNSLVSSDKDSVLSLQRTQVQSLVGKLRPHKPCCMAKKKKKTKKGKNNKTQNKVIDLSKSKYIINQSKCRMHAELLSHVQLFATPQTVACQAPLSMEFSRQEYWSGMPSSTQRVM